MKIEIKDSGTIALTTKGNMYLMSKDEINEIEKAIKLIRLLAGEMSIKTLLLETN